MRNDQEIGEMQEAAKIGVKNCADIMKQPDEGNSTPDTILATIRSTVARHERHKNINETHKGH